MLASGADTGTSDRATACATPVASDERLHVLDVLRGIALLGMFLVHFTYTEHLRGATTGAGPAVQRVAQLLLQERFHALFAILFGAGFAIQLLRAESRGERFWPRYLRRLLALLAFGIVADVGFGYRVLVIYALWGVPLLLVRRWPVRRLAVTLVLCAVSMSAYLVGFAAHRDVQRRTQATTPQAVEARRARGAAMRAEYQKIQAMQQSTRYLTVVEGRLREEPHWYSAPYVTLPANDFALFLIGLIAFRLGLFQRAREHRRLIMGMIVFGVAAWAAAAWALPQLRPAGPPKPDAPMLPTMLAWQLSWGFGLVRTEWLTLAYLGAVLLLVARDPAWLRRLGAFGWTGRMALTNYMAQVMVLDLTFSNYAFGLKFAPLVAVGAALALFVLQVFASRWWLARYRYGPLEWLWRSVTYWQRQPMRVAASAPITVPEPALA